MAILLDLGSVEKKLGTKYSSRGGIDHGKLVFNWLDPVSKTKFITEVMVQKLEKLAIGAGFPKVGGWASAFGTVTASRA